MGGEGTEENSKYTKEEETCGLVFVHLIAHGYDTYRVARCILVL